MEGARHRARACTLRGPRRREPSSVRIRRALVGPRTPPSRRRRRTRGVDCADRRAGVSGRREQSAGGARRANRVAARTRRSAPRRSGVVRRRAGPTGKPVRPSDREPRVDGAGGRTACGSPRARRDLARPNRHRGNQSRRRLASSRAGTRRRDPRSRAVSQALAVAHVLARRAPARGGGRGQWHRRAHRARGVPQRRAVRRPGGHHAARPGCRGVPLAVDDEVVVEWRALTVALLDRLAPLVWSRLGLEADPPPLVRLLEGGTWSAGRRIAAERRGGGSPPIEVASDGTVF